MNVCITVKKFSDFHFKAKLLFLKLCRICNCFLCFYDCNLVRDTAPFNTLGLLSLCPMQLCSETSKFIEFALKRYSKLQKYPFFKRVYYAFKKTFDYLNNLKGNKNLCCFKENQNPLKKTSHISYSIYFVLCVFPFLLLI